MSNLSIKGRFGNQIFKYAFLKTYAKQHNFGVETPTWVGQYLFGHKDPPISRELPQVYEIRGLADPSESVILNSNPPICNQDIWGYFQFHTSWYKAWKDYFCSLFQPVPEVEKQMQLVISSLYSMGKTLVAMHLRRGDYTRLPGFWVAPNEWYKNWLKSIWSKLEEPILFIASDNLEDVIDDFSEYNPVTINSFNVNLEQADFYPDFYVLSQSDIVAISNSTFSFAACMLNDRGKLFYRPILYDQKLINFDPWNSYPVLLNKQLFEYCKFNIENHTNNANVSEENNFVNNKTTIKTPVILIIYKKSETTEKVINVLRQVKPPKLLVIADGPKQNQPEDFDKCMQARAIIDKVDWDCEVIKNYSDTNLRGPWRVSSGLDWAFSIVEEAIILEDDCIPDLTFFRFCEELLEKYKGEEQVMMICGDNAHRYKPTEDYSYYFSRYTLIWGWATWRRAWKLFDFTLKIWPNKKDEDWLYTKLQDPRVVEHWSNKFQGNYDGNKHWDNAWMFSVWVNNGLCIHPAANLVSNIGFGADATHTKRKNQRMAVPTKAMIFPLTHPPTIVRDSQGDNFIERSIFSHVYYQPLKTEQKAINMLPKKVEKAVYDAIHNLDAQNNLEAIEIIDKILESEPNLLSLNYGKAIALARLNRKPEAVKALTCLLDLVPEHRKARGLLNQISGETLA